MNPAAHVRPMPPVSGSPDFRLSSIDRDLPGRSQYIRGDLFLRPESELLISTGGTDVEAGRPRHIRGSRGLPGGPSLVALRTVRTGPAKSGRNGRAQRVESRLRWARYFCAVSAGTPALMAGSRPCAQTTSPCKLPRDRDRAHAGRIRRSPHRRCTSYAPSVRSS